MAEDRTEFPNPAGDGGVVVERVSRNGVEAVRLGVVVDRRSNRIALKPEDAVAVALALVEYAKQAHADQVPEHTAGCRAREVLN